MANKKDKDLSLEELIEQALVSEGEQLYRVPENWVWVVLGYVCDLKSGTTIPAYNEIPIGKIPYIKVSDMNLEENHFEINLSSRYADDYKQSMVIPRNSIIFPKRGGAILTNKKRLVRQLEIIADLNVMAITPKQPINLLYVYYWFLTVDLCGLNNGSNVPQINNKDIFPLEFPLPPLSEQQRIVDRIESLFEKLDQAKGLIQDALDSFENRKSVILHKAFSGELTSKWREENRVGMASWGEEKLKNICKISSGGTPSRTVPSYYDGDIPWIKTGEIKWNNIIDSEEKITQEAILNSSAKLVPKGSVLLAMYGQGLTRGRASILDVDAATNQAVCVLVPDGRLINKFLYYFFMCNYWKFREEAVGGNQPNFSGKIVGEFVINIPQIDEQREILRILDTILGLEENAIELSDVIENIDGMKKSILGRAFRGELGTTDLYEESVLPILKHQVLTSSGKALKQERNKSCLNKDGRKQFKTNIELKIYTKIVLNEDVEMSDLLKLSSKTSEVVNAIDKLEANNLIKYENGYYTKRGK